MKFLTIALALCALLAAVAAVHGKRSQEDEPSLLDLLKQGLGQFLVNSLENVKTLLSGSPTWQDMIYVNSKNPYEEDEDGILSGEKSEVLSLLYVLVKQMDLLLENSIASKYKQVLDAAEYDDDDEYDDYDWTFGGNSSNGKDDHEDEDDDYDLSDLLNYFDADDDDDEYESVSDYADRDGEEDDDYDWYSLFGSGAGDGENYDEEDYEGDYEEDAGVDSASNVIKTESNATDNEKTQLKPTAEKDASTETNEVNNMIKDIKVDAVKETSKTN